jgi:hypothetical protein
MDIQQTLTAHGQDQVLRFWHDLTADQQAGLRAQLEAID